MKYAEKLYPKGTFKKQQTDGAFIDDTLAPNLEVYCKKIVDDMSFLILVSGSDAVGNGKSTLVSQMASYMTHRINQLHGINNTFTADNMHFNSEELVKKSFEHPKYSIEVLDEGDDLTALWMKESAMNLKRYFRKCRQLNQILILILPSFFELPKFYALARSHALINVKFEGDFQRGFFKFYGPKAKKLLYLFGKKSWDYDAHGDDFHGRFSQEYCFYPNPKEETEKYKQRKYRDMINDADRKKPVSETGMKAKLFRQVHERLKKVTAKELAHAFGVSERTGSRYLSKEYAPDTPPVELEVDISPKYINIGDKGDDGGEEERVD